MPRSIAGRLVLWTLVTIAGFLVGFSAFVYERQRETSMAVIDDGLRSKAEFVASMIEIFPGGSVHFEPTEHRERYPTAYDSPGSGRYYQIWFADGRPLTRSRSLGEYVFPLTIDSITADPRIETLIGPDGGNVRVYTRRVAVQPLQGGDSQIFVVQTGESLADVERFLALLRRAMLIGVPVILGFAALGGYGIAVMSLRPLRRFSAEIGQISEQTLDRRIAEERVNSELRDLAAAFNAMLARMQAVFAQQRRFVSDASHELRTPVSVIKSWCEVSLRRDRTVGEYKQRLRTILRHTEKMAALIDSLLTLSRLQHRRVPLARSRVELNHVVGTTVASLAPLATRKDIAARCQLAPQPVAVWGDETGLTEVFTNLLDNAIKYTRPGGSVTVRVESEGHEAVVTVADTGVGIAPEALPHLFERFYRAEASRTGQVAGDNGEPAGFGLGLSIVREWVDAHRGRILVTSDVGKGSVFTVRFPSAP